MNAFYENQRLFNAVLHGLGIVGVLLILVSYLTLRQQRHAERLTLEIAETQSIKLLQISPAVHAGNVAASQDLSSMLARNAQWKAKIPTESGEIDFMSRLSEIADATEFRIRDFRPGMVKSQPLYQEMEIRFVGEGTYPAICRFLDELKKLPRSYHMVQLSLTQQNDIEQNCLVECQLQLAFDLHTDLNLEEVTL